LDEKPEDSYKIKALHFMRLLGEVAETLDTVKTIAYKCQITEPTRLVPFAQLVIEWNTGADKEREPLMFGEFYTLQDQKGDNKTYQYYSLRWPITCLEEQLVAGLC
jgi:hypothetical protein